MQSGRSTEFTVGIFVTISLLIGTAIIFALGNQSAMFDSRARYRAVFTNVAGLRPGSPVRLAGIEVGSVSEVRLLDDGRCEAQLEVRSGVAHLITHPTNPETGTGGTVATMGSKGLLGDVLIDLTAGSGTPVPPGATIPAHESAGIFAMAEQAGELINEVKPTLENVREFTDTLANEQFREDLGAISHNLAELTRMLTEENGTVPRLIRDEQMADRVEQLIGSAQVATTELAGTMRNVRRITDEIQGGDGSVHEIIYGQEGARLVHNLADGVGEAATILRDARTGDGNMHELLYGDSAGELIANLTEMSSDLQVIASNVRQGRGTIGGLLTDPSIYEDIKRLVGNLERNDILRALVRYSIREDQQVAAPPTATESSF